MRKFKKLPAVDISFENHPSEVIKNDASCLNEIVKHFLSELESSYKYIDGVVRLFLYQF